MSATRNAPFEAPHALKQAAPPEPVNAPNLLSSEEVANHQLVRLKTLFSRVETELSPPQAPPTIPRKRPRSIPKRRSSARARPRSATASPSRQRLNRAAHEARCTICRHPERDAIEEEFIHWLSPRTMRDAYGVESRAVYRHAHAFNLFAVRDRNLRFALGHIIDRVERISESHGPDVIRAVHAFARVNNEGQWVEPPSHIIVSSGAHPAPPHRGPLDAIRQPALPPPASANSHENAAENPHPSLDTHGRTEHNVND
jgi:hypothetical protein